MIQITYSAGSPFVRKARIVTAMKGIVDKVEYVGAVPDDARGQALRASNPLEKIPAGKLDDGSLIYDSHVICEYLDAQAPAPRLFPPAGPDRWRALTLAAMADGMTECAVLIVYESRYRPPALWHQGWVDRQQAKVDAALAHLEANIPDWKSHPDYGHISLACALGFLDVRHEGRWRAAHPKLVTWFDRFAAAVPAWSETAPPKA